MLLVGEDEVNGPAAADMRSSPTEMTENIHVRATGFLQSICQDREPGVV